MKKIWQKIVLFFQAIAYHEKLADDVVELLSKEREYWTTVEKNPNPGAILLRFEKEGPYFETTISFDTISTTIEVGGETHVFWFSQSLRLHEAAFPETCNT